MRAGVTLVETLVAAGLSTVVLTAAFAMYSAANRGRGASATARSLQTAMMIEERVADDLARLVRRAPALVRWWPDRPARLAFWTFEPGARGRELPVRAVLYALPGPGKLLARTTGGRTTSVGVQPLTTLAFHPLMSPTGPMVRLSFAVGRDASDLAGPPLNYSFLARIAAPRRFDELAMKVESDFADPADSPTDQLLPVP